MHNEPAPALHPPPLLCLAFFFQVWGCTAFVIDDGEIVARAINLHSAALFPGWCTCRVVMHQMPNVAITHVVPRKGNALARSTPAPKHRSA